MGINLEGDYTPSGPTLGGQSTGSTVAGTVLPLPYHPLSTCNRKKTTYALKKTRVVALPLIHGVEYIVTCQVHPVLVKKGLMYGPFSFLNFCR